MSLFKKLFDKISGKVESRYDNFPFVSEPLDIRKNTNYSSNSSSNSNQTNNNDMLYEVKYEDGYYEAKIEAYEQSTPVQYQSSQSNSATYKTYAEILAEWEQKREQEQQAKRVAEDKARLIAEENAKRVAEEKARLIAEENARRVAEEKAAQAVRDAEYIKKGDKCFMDAECMMFAIFGYEAFALQKLEKYIEAKNWYLKASCDCSNKIKECNDMIGKKIESTKKMLKSELKFAIRSYNSSDYDSVRKWLKSVENSVNRLNKLNIDLNNDDVLESCENIRQAMYEQIEYDKKLAECEDAYSKAKEIFDRYQNSLNSNSSINDYSSCLNDLDEVYSLMNEASDCVDTSDLFNAVKEAEEEWQNIIDELKND